MLMLLAAKIGMMKMNTTESIFIRNKISGAITSAFDNKNYIMKYKGGNCCKTHMTAKNGKTYHVKRKSRNTYADIKRCEMTVFYGNFFHPVATIMMKLGFNHFGQVKLLRASLCNDDYFRLQKFGKRGGEIILWR
ncbi:hypothetical protein [Sodalis praecaptivus]|uniref:hypothetical protein n=1 Tax=Sodalis TaxID=84565 RepID=UPI00046D0F11|nr:hypothetical protein [Sodalis praecaptivus]